MLFPDLATPLVNEQTAASEQAVGFRNSARSASRNLRSFGFQAIAFLLGIALAFM